MQNIPYKFENYALADFPVYASSPIYKYHIVNAHYHSGAEFIKVINGSVEVHAATETYVLSEGDLIFFSPFSIHEVTSEDPDAKIRGFVFDMNLLDNYIDFHTMNKTHFVFTKTHSKNREISQIFDDLHKLYQEMPKTFRLRILANLLLVISIFAEYGLISIDESENNLRTAPVIKHIQNHYDEPITTSDLSSIVNLCEDSFIRLFKKEHGETPFTYIINLRISEALKLLYENKYSISEIAAMTGFSSQSYFTKAFKEKLGVSPLRYKKKHFCISNKKSDVK